MTLLASYQLATDATYLHQVQMAALAQAHAVIAEQPTAHSQADAKRHALAVAVLADGGVSTSPKFAYGVAAIPGFAATAGDAAGANDAAINSAMVGKWNDFAGVTAQDLING